MPSGNRPLTTGLHSGIRSSEPNCRLIPPRSSLLHTCSRRSQCPTSASHSSRPTVGLGACGLELPATCPGEVILQIREKNRGKDNPSGRRCSLLPTMSSSERESRKLLGVARKAAIGTSRTFADVRSYAASGGEATSTVVIHAAGIYE